MKKIFENWRGYLGEMTRAKKEGVFLPSVIEELKKYQVETGTPATHFIHFTDVNKLGINPQSSFKTPLGIYSYPVTDYIVSQLEKYEIPFAQDRKYIILFKLKEGAKIINNDMSEGELEDYDWAIVRAMNKKKSHLPYYDFNFSRIPRYNIEHAYSDSPLGRLWYDLYMTSNYYSKDNAPVIWNAFFRGLGIDGVEDYQGAGIIHENEPIQAVFFSKPALEIVKVFDNKIVNKEQRMFVELSKFVEKSEYVEMLQFDEINYKKVGVNFVIMIPEDFKGNFEKATSSISHQEFVKKKVRVDPDFVELINSSAGKEKRVEFSGSTLTDKLYSIALVVYLPEHEKFVKRMRLDLDRGVESHMGRYLRDILIRRFIHE